MRSKSPVLVGLLLVVVTLAGCIGGSGDAPAPDGPAQNDSNDSVTPDNVNDFTKDSAIKVKENTKFDPSSTIHPHDYWVGRNQVDIIDGETVSLDWNSMAQGNPEIMNRPSFIVDVTPREVNGELVPNMVFPGTATINVTLEWSGGGDSKAICVTNQGASGNLCAAEGLGHTFSNGETWTIDNTTDNGNFLNEDTWDAPHSLKSNWRFQVWVCTNGGSGVVCPADLQTTEFTLTVTVIRGGEDLPIDPPHFAFYDEGQESIAILNDAAISSGPVQSNWAGQAYQQATGRSRPYWYVSGFQLTHPPLDASSEIPVVSWETERLEVKFTANAANGDVAQLQLKYRTAADAWSAEWRDAGDPCSAECQITIPVTKADADSPYAYQTQWEFGIFPADVPTVPLVQYDVRLEIIGYSGPT